MLDTTPAISPQPQPELGSPKRHQCYGFRTGWIAATTHPQAERRADANLRLRGYQTFLPVRTIKRRDRVLPTLSRSVQVPLFPGYIFLHYDSRDPRRPIRETPGVRDVVRCGQQVQWVNAGVLEAVRAVEAQAASDYQPDPPWRPGASVALANGPFAGLPAVVTQTDANNVTIAVMFLGSLRQISVHESCLTPRPG